MESLNYAFEGRGFLFNDSGLELPVDSFTRSRSLLKELNLNPFSDHEGEELFMESSSALSPFDPFLPAKRTVPENDPKEVTIIQSSKKRSDLSSAKRPRVTNFSPQQVLVCQVHGCNRDLSSSKDYHKRHKVCDEHSKTAKVIVNGIEQRFCQQCSRFHLLAEFDDDKRSCRKRLAGHNERRRKPHRDSQWDIVGSRFIDLRVEKTVSFLFPEITTHSNFCHESYEQEGRQVCSSRRTLPRPKPHLEETFQVQDFCGGENSISSHSLLSPHSDPKGDLGVENYPSLGMSSTSTNFTLSELDGFGVAVEGEGVLEVHDGNIGLNYEAEVDMNLQRADCMNLSCHFYPENGETIDLQQLSMHLLRVEQQRSYDQVKHDSSNFCFTTT